MLTAKSQYTHHAVKKQITGIAVLPTAKLIVLITS